MGLLSQVRTTEDAIKKLSNTRAWMLINRPFFGFLLMYLDFKIVDLASGSGIKTAATDGKSIWFCIEFMRELTDDELRFVLAHEVMHVALRHTSRRGVVSRLVGKNHDKMNRAADYVINLMLKESGMTPLVGALYDEQWKDHSTEGVYKKLSDDPADDKGFGGPAAGPGTMKGPGGAMTPWKKGDGWGDDHSQWGKGEEGSLDDQVWKRRITASATYAGKHCPGCVKSMVDSIVHPNIPWKQLIMQNAQAMITADFAWVPPNKRHVANGIYIPGRKPGECFEGSVYFDYSGSIGDSDIEEFVGGLDEIMMLFDEWELEVSMFDTAIRKTMTFVTGDDIDAAKQVVGRGGTDFSVCFAHAVRDGRKPKIVIIFTDGYCSWPENPDNLNIVWIYTRTATREEPPYGLVCRIGGE
jgi:predicted metal-dependent peptidase